MNRIKDLRLARNMKQTDLAALLSLTGTAISNYEIGVRDIDSETICRLCDIFGCTADYLLGRSPLPTAELTAEEEQLLLAWRAADDRARDVIAAALRPFTQENTSERAI